MLLQDGPEDTRFKIAGLLGCALTEASLSIRHGRINVQVADEEMSQGGLQMCEPCPFNGVGAGGHGCFPKRQPFVGGDPKEHWPWALPDPVDALFQAAPPL